MFGRILQMLDQVGDDAAQPHAFHKEAERPEGGGILNAVGQTDAAGGQGLERMLVTPHSERPAYLLIAEEGAVGVGLSGRLEGGNARGERPADARHTYPAAEPSCRV